MTETCNLEQVGFFAGLDPDEIRALAGVASPFALAAGEMFFRQADVADEMFVIEYGRVQVSVRLPGDEEIVIDEVGPGEVLGELSLLENTTRMGSARCVEPTHGYAISRTAVTELLWRAANPTGFRLILRVLQSASARLREVTDDIARVLNEDVEGFATAPVGVSRSAVTTQMSPHPRPEELASLPFFAEFESHELRQLLASTKSIGLPRGQVLFEEGDDASSCFVVVSGAVEVKVRRGEVSERVALLGPGKMVGQLALIDTCPRSATCVIRERATLLELSTEEFDRLLEGKSRIGLRFVNVLIRSMADGLRRSEQRLKHFAVEGKVQLGRA